MAPRFDTVAAYLDALPSSTRGVMDAVLATVRAAVPDADEAIKYQMPTFVWRGHNLLHVGAWKTHLAVYPVPAGPPELLAALAPYLTEKSTLRFALTKEIPLDLVHDVAVARQADLAARP